MKTLLTGAVIATLAFTTAALAFGPGSGFGSGYRANGQNQSQSFGRHAGRGMGGQGMGGQGMMQASLSGEPVFMDGWDANEDGTVTLSEARDHRLDLFDGLDENEDGQITAAEFRTFLDNTTMAPDEATNRQRGLYGMTLSFNDANQDGVVTKAEFLTQTQAWLAFMDRSGDGVVNAQDFGPKQAQMGNSQGMERGMGRGVGRTMDRGMRGGQGSSNGRGQGMGWFQPQG